MATEVERLIVRLEASQAKFEKQMARANQVANKRARAIETRFDKMNKTVSAGALRLGGAFVAAFASGAAVRAIRDTALEVANLAGEAEQAGVSFEALQELKFATEQSKIGVDALTDGLKEMALRADEFVVTGKGSAAEAFARLGFSAAELKKSLEEPDKLFEQIIGRLETLDKAAQIRIADEIFGGTGGEQFVRLLDEGVVNLRTARQEARKLGLVMDEDIAKKAEEVDRKFQVLANQVGVNLKEAIIVAADALSVFLDRFKEIEARGRSSLESSLTQLGSDRLDVENQILRLKEKQANATGVLAQAEKRQLGGSISQLQGRMDAIAAEEKRVLDTLKQRFPINPTERGGGRKFTPKDLPGSGGGSKNKTDSFQREIDQIIARTMAIQSETQAMSQINPLIDVYGFAIEKARAQQQLLAAAQQDGRKITPELMRSIESLSGAYAAATVESEQLTDEQDQLVDAVEDMRDLGQDVLGGFISDLRSGKSATEALAGALDRVADKLLDIALNNVFDGGGGGDGILGSLFGGGGGKGGLLGGAIIPGILHRGGVAGRDGYGHGRAVSPSVFAGAPRMHGGGVAGLRPGEVPAILKKGEPVLPSMQALRNIAGGSSGPRNVNINVNVDGANGDSHVIALVRQGVSLGLSEYDRELGDSMPDRIAQAQVRAL